MQDDDDPTWEQLLEIVTEARRRAAWLPCGKQHFAVPCNGQLTEDGEVAWETSVRTVLRRAPGGWEVSIDQPHAERAAAAEAVLGHWALVVYRYPERRPGHEEESYWLCDPEGLPDYAHESCRATAMGRGISGVVPAT